MIGYSAIWGISVTGSVRCDHERIRVLLNINAYLIYPLKNFGVDATFHRIVIVTMNIEQFQVLLWSCSTTYIGR